METFHIPAEPDQSPRIQSPKRSQGSSNCLVVLSRPALLFYYRKITCAKKMPCFLWSKPHGHLDKWTMDITPQKIKWVLTSLHQPEESVWFGVCLFWVFFCLCVCMSACRSVEEEKRAQSNKVPLVKGWTSVWSQKCAMKSTEGEGAWSQGSNASVPVFQDSNPAGCSVSRHRHKDSQTQPKDC